MMDMKRRVGAIMDFISRTQLDLAAEALPSSSESSTRPSSPEKRSVSRTNGEGASSLPVDETDAGTYTPQNKDFKELNCVEMMDVLTRDMVKWQNQYA